MIRFVDDTAHNEGEESEDTDDYRDLLSEYHDG